MSEQVNQGAAIRTPDQRLRVFVSSTLAELAEERAAVSRAISALRLTPVLFELGARPHPPQELYRAYLAQSDIFIGIYWQRYGWVGPGMDISGLEDEFQLSQAMPRLLYLKAPAPEREERLTAMIRSLQADGTTSYRSFRSPRELGRLVREDLAVLLSERFAGQRDVSSAAAAGSSRAQPHVRTLPSTSTSLVGREQDIAQVAKLLEAPDVRLVTLTGPGGIGKTRLAVALAASLEDRYPMATVFVPLASITDPAQVLPAIAGALGASLEGTTRPLDALVEHLGDTPTLLVLDNLEQVVGVGPDLDDLLTRCPGLKILATSRTALRLRAEHEYAVSALTVPVFPEPPALEQVTSLPALELFADRARAVRRDFALNEDNAVAVAEICRRLDGLPLAIELAAARVRLLDPSALLARLGSRLDVLGTGPVDLPERQRTLRGTIDWSVGLLSDAEKEMLATLSVFVDGWTLEAAVSVSGLDEDRTLDLLDALAGHSLVSIDAGGHGPRFRMLETVREFSAELLSASSSSSAVEQRHAAYFREFAESTVWPLPDETAWAERLQTEEGNLRRAIRWFFTNDIAALPHLFRLLWRYWMLRDRMAEGRAWIDELLARETSLDDEGRAEVWLTSATTASEVGDDDAAAIAARELEHLQGRIEDRYLQSAMQMALSWVLPVVDDLDGAKRAASMSLQGFREQDEPMMEVNVVFTLGLLEMAMGSFDAAHQHLSEVYDSRKQFGDHWLASVACALLGSLAVEAGRLDEARVLLDEALQRSLDMERSTRMATFCLVAYAELTLATGEPQQSALALGAVDGLRARTGLRPWPLVRPGETRLLAGVREALPPQQFQDAFAAGFHLSRQDAVAIMRGNAAT
jgi:predicted ATPase